MRRLLGASAPPLLLLLIFLKSYTTDALRVVISNTTTSPSDLAWDQWIRPNKDGQRLMGDAWNEETLFPPWLDANAPSSDSAMSNLRSISSCSSNGPPLSNNYLLTPFFERVPGVERYVVVLLYSIRTCANAEAEQKCTERFTVYTNRIKRNRRFDTKAAANQTTFDMQPWKFAESFEGATDKHLGDADPYASNHEKFGLTERELSVPFEDDDIGMHLAFLDSGACVSLMGISVVYDVCEEATIGLARYSKTMTTRNERDYATVNGRCVDNAEGRFPGMPVTAICKSDGTWGTTSSSSCVCKTGFQSKGGKTCEACHHGSYSTMGGPCKMCPPGTHVNLNLDGCECNDNYFRVRGKNSQYCFTAPSGPTHLVAHDITQTEAVLMWGPPHSDGTPISNDVNIPRPTVQYSWKCYSCTPEQAATIVGTPEHEIPTTSSRVTLRGLEPGVEYSFAVYAHNEVSRENNLSPDIATANFTTRAALPHTVQPRKVADTEEGVTFEWKAPAAATKGGVTYEVERTTNGKNPQREIVKEPTKTYNDLRNGVNYTFRVRSKMAEWGQWSDPLPFNGVSSIISQTTELADKRSAIQDIPLWVVVIGVALFILFILFFALIFRKKTSNRKQMSDLDVLDTYKQDTMTPDYNTAHRQPFNPLNECFKPPAANKLNAPLIPYGDATPKSGVSSGYGMALPSNPNRFKPYVDPMAYEDPNQALTEFAFEIPPEAIATTAVIGGGEFGEVCQAQLNTAMLRRTNVGAALIAAGYETDSETVACKLLKGGSDAKARADFLLEASIMGQFVHPNVVRLIGVVSKREPVMIVTEFMAHGSLDQFLRGEDARGRIEMETIVRMLHGIASGMKYLTDKGFVHRDLAARNVLVDGSLTCKVSDFGLSRGVDGLADQEYTTNGGKIPVRWTAPEAITHRKFTTASDVWSFGVLMWEVCSFGERPYWEWTNQRVISAIMSGFRLPPPMDCPPTLHRLMMMCWQIDRHDRPSFAQLVSVLDRYLSQPELIYGGSDSGASSDGRTRSMANLSGAYAVAPSASIYNGDRTPQIPSGAPPSPPLDEFVRSLGLAHAADRLRAAGVTRTEQLQRTNHLELLACGLTPDECQRIREAVAHLRTTAHHAASNSTTTLLSSNSAGSADRPVPARRVGGFAETVATMPSRGSTRTRGTDDHGFFV